MTALAARTPVVFVLAGVNGAGKSSIGGALLRQDGLNYFNPDEAAQRIRDTAGCSIDEANALAWNEGKQRFEAAIESQSNYAFETTLGGNTIPGLIRSAAESGMDVLMWFVGLSSLGLHIARVRARVAAGGHDIPEHKIRERWDSSRRNLIVLLPSIAELKVFDNSSEGDASAGTIPEPALLLHWHRGKIVAPTLKQLEMTPDWAKPIVAAALKLQRRK
jgi:predicted ABC-type ATPase